MALDITRQDACRISAWMVAWAVAFVCALHLVDAGLLRDSPARYLDAQWLYVSGAAWLAGDSPYNVHVFHAHWEAALGSQPWEPPSFLYPPPIALVTVPGALLYWRGAQVYFTVLSLAALVLTWIMCLSLLRDGVLRGRGVAAPVLVGLSSFVSGVAGCLHIGQTGLLAICGAVGVLWAARRRKPWALAFFLVLAAIKPQLTVLVCLYALVVFGWRVFAPAFVVLAAVCTLVIAASDPQNIVGDYRVALERHLSMAFNQKSSYEHLGGIFVGVPNAVLGTVGLAVAAGLGWIDQRRSCAAVSFTRGFMAVGAATLAFMPLHQYDWVILVPCILFVCNERGWKLAIALAFAMLLLGRLGNVQALLSLVGLHDPNRLFAAAALVGFLVLALVCWHGGIKSIRPRASVSAGCRVTDAR